MDPGDYKLKSAEYDSTKDGQLAYQLLLAGTAPSKDPEIEAPDLQTRLMYLEAAADAGITEATMTLGFGLCTALLGARDEIRGKNLIQKALAKGSKHHFQVLIDIFNFSEENYNEEGGEPATSEEVDDALEEIFGVKRDDLKRYPNGEKSEEAKALLSETLDLNLASRKDDLDAIFSEAKNTVEGKVTYLKFVEQQSQLANYDLAYSLDFVGGLQSTLRTLEQTDLLENKQMSAFFQERSNDPSKRIMSGYAIKTNEKIQQASAGLKHLLANNRLKSSFADLAEPVGGGLVGLDPNRVTSLVKLENLVAFEGVVPQWVLQLFKLEAVIQFLSGSEEYKKSREIWQVLESELHYSSEANLVMKDLLDRGLVEPEDDFVFEKPADNFSLALSADWLKSPLVRSAFQERAESLKANIVSKYGDLFLGTPDSPDSKNSSTIEFENTEKFHREAWEEKRDGSFTNVEEKIDEPVSQGTPSRIAQLSYIALIVGFLLFVLALV